MQRKEYVRSYFQLLRRFRRRELASGVDDLPQGVEVALGKDRRPRRLWRLVRPVAAATATVDLRDATGGRVLELDGEEVRGGVAGGAPRGGGFQFTLLAASGSRVEFFDAWPDEARRTGTGLSPVGLRSPSRACAAAGAATGASTCSCSPPLRPLL